jgi:4-hydroxybenzoyl-CoA thioesterase
MAFTAVRPLRFGDCDPSGIAYFPSYLNLLVGVMEEFFASIGSPWPVMMGERRISVPTVRLDITFSHPGVHGDVLEFRVDVKRVGGSSLDFLHRITCGGTLLWSAEQRVVATDTDTHRARPWPDDMRAALEQHLETCNV